MFNKNDFIYDGIRISEYVYVESIRRQILPSVTNYLKEIPNRDGLLYRTNTKSSRFTEVDIRLITKNNDEMNDIKNLIAKTLYQKSPKRLELRDLPGKYEFAIVDGEVAFEKLFNTGFTTITFLNPDGFIYSNQINHTLINNGNAACHWTLEGKTKDNVVTILDTDSLNKISISTSNFEIGSDFKYESEWEHVYINNKSGMRGLAVESDNFMLDPGQNNIEVSGLENYTFTHRDRWL